MAEQIHGQSCGSQVLTAQLPVAQIGIAKVSCHLPINLTSNEGKGTSEHAVMDSSPAEMTCPPQEAEGNTKSLDTQKPWFSSDLLYKQAAFKLPWAILI